MKVQIGFVVDDLSSGQIPYLLLKKCNQFIDNRMDTNLNIFYENNAIPCLHPKIARFHVREAKVFDGHLVGTSLKTTNSIRNCSRSRRYYYINDLEFLRKNTNKTEWESILNDPKIVKFTRSKDYLKEIQGQNINSKIVKDFDIDVILEIINESKRN